MRIHILTDSASDMTNDEYDRYQIHRIPLSTYFGTEEFLDGVTISHDEFFTKLTASDTLPTTSQITPAVYAEAFDRLLADPEDQVLCITLSGGLSGSFQNAYLTAQDYDGRVAVVDSENACVGERILVLYAARLRDQGLSLSEIVEELKVRRKKIRLYAVLDTLEYLKKGGRISSAAAIAGSLLSIKPLISIEEGKVAVVGKARGNKAANARMNEMIRSEEIDTSMPASLVHSGLSDELLVRYMSTYSAAFEGFGSELASSTIGCTIGTHIGPGAIGAAFFVR